MKTFKIFISRNEKSYDAALKMKNESNIESSIFYIEDFVKDNLFDSITDDDIIHFSCNSELIYIILDKIKDKKCYIFNKQFLLKKYSKKQIQLKFYDNGIKIPKIYNNLENIMLPVFCKENKHTGIVFEAFTSATLIEIFKKFDIKDFYFEENIVKKEEITKEFKIYYANNKAFAKNNNVVTKHVISVCNKIVECLSNIEIFSVDFIETEEGLYLIDFNPSVGFYLSDDGRKNLLYMVDKIAN